MTWYSFHIAHVKDYDDSISYLNSDRSIYSANLIETYYQKYLKGNYQEVSDEPDFNPLVEHDFLYEMSMKDIYISLGKLSR
jgi:hypothetical protein